MIEIAVRAYSISEGPSGMLWTIRFSGCDAISTGKLFPTFASVFIIKPYSWTVNNEEKRL